MPKAKNVSKMKGIYIPRHWCSKCEKACDQVEGIDGLCKQCND
jgi:hypothetical protein